jgi:S-adenosylmethionine:tRNA ribosyltransferase-isomerase
MPSSDSQLSSYNYELPQNLIAQHPAAERDQSRMLMLERQSGQISHHNFAEIVSLLPESSCLVINNTKVLPARLPGKRQTGAVIEALLLKKKAKASGLLLSVRPEESILASFLNFAGDVCGQLRNKDLKRENGCCHLKKRNF